MIKRIIRKYKAIRHYKRMIKWAKKQPVLDRPNKFTMKKEIGESWFSDFCSYCREYERTTYPRLNCRPCELSSVSHNCCCGGKWQTMADSPNWGRWIRNAYKVLEYIKKNG